ncbi:ubiquitin specific peptidase 15 [Capsaspora owczarzaki ATCC 30864]|nr:ubiquitin specific peptidase 15 [Capsaspora owczarzaki ATCC 30864]|eukprot:XP_004346117.2 ubiquitin specific peptidase 15 [Capsaspora owczarzaki ATCC 30864]
MSAGSTGPDLPTAAAAAVATPAAAAAVTTPHHSTSVLGRLLSFKGKRSHSRKSAGRTAAAGGRTRCDYAVSAADAEAELGPCPTTTAPSATTVITPHHAAPHVTSKPSHHEATGGKAQASSSEKHSRNGSIQQETETSANASERDAESFDERSASTINTSRNRHTHTASTVSQSSEGSFGGNSVQLAVTDSDGVSPLSPPSVSASSSDAKPALTLVISPATPFLTHHRGSSDGSSPTRHHETHASGVLTAPPTPFDGGQDAASTNFATSSSTPALHAANSKEIITPFVASSGHSRTDSAGSTEEARGRTGLFSRWKKRASTSSSKSEQSSGTNGSSSAPAAPNSSPAGSASLGSSTTSSGIKTPWAGLKSSSTASTSASNGPLWSSGMAGSASLPTPPGSAPLGATGLVNIGNTCFMNSVLQCISNTNVLCEYFIGSRFKDEINTKNNLGTKGEVVSQLAHLVKDLWSGRFKCIRPDDFKSGLVKFAPQFQGSLQHDAQEFLAYLMDAIHEDLNRILKKPCVEVREGNGTGNILLELQLAVDSWKDHQLRNNSFVVDNFQGQLKSTLVCPGCGRRSVKFDPFMYLSLPLPKQVVLRKFIITMVWLDPTRQATRFLVNADPSGTVHDVRLELARLAGLSVDAADELCLSVQDYNRLQPLPRTQPLDAVAENFVLVAFEGCEAFSDTRQTRIIVAQQDQRVDTNSFGAKRFDPPFMFMVPSNISYADLYQEVLNQNRSRYFKPTAVVPQSPYAVAEASKAATSAVEPETAVVPEAAAVVLVQEPTAEGGMTFAAESLDTSSDDTGASSSLTTVASESSPATGEAQKAQKVDGLIASPDSSSPATSATAASTADAQPAQPTTPNPEDALFMMKTLKNSTELIAAVDCKDLALPPTLTLLCEWIPKERKALFDDSRITGFTEHETLRQHHQRPYSYDSDETFSLHQCFGSFLQEEKLGADDAWYCSKCKQHQEGAVKKLELWKLPDVLIVHLKRFQFTTRLRKKLTDTVTFPLTDIDMSHYCPNASRIEEALQHPSDDVSPAQLQRATANLETLLGPHKGSLYDVYAVCNHFGSLGGGHYTAFCKNPLSGIWYSYDDSRVEKVDPSTVVSKSAYIMFLVRKDAARLTQQQVEQAVLAQTSLLNATQPQQQAAAQQAQPAAPDSSYIGSLPGFSTVTSHDIEIVGRRTTPSASHHRRTESNGTTYEEISDAPIPPPAYDIADSPIFDCPATLQAFLNSPETPL